jgi:hypothetical protein
MMTVLPTGTCFWNMHTWNRLGFQSVVEEFLESLRCYPHDRLPLAYQKRTSRETQQMGTVG